MHTAAIAAALAPIHDRIARARGGQVERGDVDGIRFAVTPDRVSRFPSGNGNTARWYGDATDADAIERIAERYEAHGVPLWFLHLHAGADLAAMVDTAERAGLEPFTGTTYPVLVHHGGVIPPGACDLAIEREAVLEPTARALLAGPQDGAVASRLAADGDLQVFTARTDDDQVVAVGGLMVQRGVGYLGWGSTREDHRGEGAHSALIRARLMAAKQAGCRLIVAESLGMLTTSLGNLERAGFQIAYERAVMQAGDDE